MIENISDKRDFKRPNKKLIIASLILIVLNIIFYPIVMKNTLTFGQTLVFFLFSVNLLGILIGVTIALIPYKKLPYDKKFIRISLIAILGINFTIASSIFLLYAMTIFGWHGREYSNAKNKPFSDTILVYDDSGRVRAKGIMINKLKEGNWKEWDENGALVTDMNYQNGLAEGHGVMYYPNGKKQLEGNYVNEKADGHFINWYSNGNKKAEGDFKQNEKIGVWKTWFENGELGQSVDYTNPTK